MRVILKRLLSFRPGPRRASCLVRSARRLLPAGAVIGALLLVSTTTSPAQVQSLTLGIDVNSPYGITEPWVTIRDGFLRCEFIESVSPQPNRSAATGEFRPRHGQLPALELLAKTLRDTGAGASLRGVEVCVEGTLSKEKNAFWLRSPGVPALPLRPLTGVIQLGQQPTDMEKGAYAALTANWTGQSVRVKVVGPLLKDRVPDASGSSAAGSLALEVRQFTFLR